MHQTSSPREFYGHLTISTILVCTQAYSVYLTVTTGLTLTTQHYVGFAATGLIAAALLLRRTWLCYVLGAVLLLGTDNWLGFSPLLDCTKCYVGSGITPVQIQNYSFTLLLMWFIFSYGRLAQTVRSLRLRS